MLRATALHEWLMTPTVAQDVSTRTREPQHWAALGALGIVYGDLGTSPLYTLQTVVQATGGHFTTASALGILSLLVWTLIITISIKYCLFVMRADNHGEGGILALMSLVGANRFKGTAKILAVMGLLGAALLYGDGVITPAISVLSALEGVNVVTGSLKPFVMPAAVAILIVFFAAQRFGTARIGAAFGPIMLLWFLVIAVLGLTGIVRNPSVLTALDPRHAIGFLAHSGGNGMLVLGGVFLCITGGEALYADMGHFGPGPIRLSWYAIVLPSLLLSYAGQTALLIQKGTIEGNPFFQLCPTWGVYPLVFLAMIATIIASQSIITGSFSMTRQAMQLGWLPGFHIRQTSDKVYGQIYVPVVNWMMMVATIGITIAFGSSDRLAGAYGTAVSTTMLLTTCLLFTAMRKTWRWPLAVSILIAGLFLIVDVGFFGANLLKIAEGGWLPLTFGALVFFLMLTWRSGIDAVRESLAQASEAPERFVADLAAGKVPRVPGTAIFLTRTYQKIPPLLIDHVKHMGALHQSVIALTILFEESPRIDDEERCGVEKIADGIWRVTMRFGFVEIPDLTAALKRVKGLDPSIDLDHAIYFATRDIIVARAGSSLFAHWRLPVFAFLYRNAVKVVDRFSLPPDRVVEIARQIEL
ncbi:MULTISPECIES: potassium transporter Kup [Alphaproteobacteria]|jgi:KUP system potassium uptake protein|uniref:Probable potassium transport system protein Kup 4 n=4 Tax=Pseudomonadota TaxID=1224 RepID=KUP4_BRASB|nr:MULTISPECIES: KUP/HAK/KT family potassium transporter [Alphaproteobacteria]A5ESW9.1 RecName: Full=Probable potassium transport system protein Kup 4 [Bradyrhizobium sp. BTAi1]ABQ39263.1 putative potassium uptake protein Kup [Bradyrhizobium sp. BTAi1]ENZ78107.1 K+ transporter [Caulobacter vibrioides OR37]MBD3848659.1 KUP/HAK/KT family potassium transporter [Bosea spartocytisi]MBN9255369.1 KUP/HAK/KT family potassium transporter [Mesorhizobium sp.]MCT4471691.1 KUP/HAK/KT family potassium tran